MNFIRRNFSKTLTKHRQIWYNVSCNIVLTCLLKITQICGLKRYWHFIHVYWRDYSDEFKARLSHSVIIICCSALLSRRWWYAVCSVAPQTAKVAVFVGAIRMFGGSMKVTYLHCSYARMFMAVCDGAPSPSYCTAGSTCSAGILDKISGIRPLPSTCWQ